VRRGVHLGVADFFPSVGSSRFFVVVVHVPEDVSYGGGLLEHLHVLLPMVELHLINTTDARVRDSGESGGI